MKVYSVSDNCSNRGRSHEGYVAVRGFLRKSRKDGLSAEINNILITYMHNHIYDPKSEISCLSSSFVSMTCIAL